MTIMYKMFLKVFDFVSFLVLVELRCGLFSVSYEVWRGVGRLDKESVVCKQIT